MMLTASTSSRGREVWDPFIRTFHLGLLSGVAGAWWTYEVHLMTWHRWLGDGVIGLLVFRLYWGFVGPETARFAAFLKGPATVWRYLRGRWRPAPGHNPAGGWAVVALLSMVTLQSASGQFTADREGLAEGPFAGGLTINQAETAHRLHVLGFDLLLALAGLHVTVVVLHLLKGDDLIRPMITGRTSSDLSEGPGARRAWWLPLPGVGAGLLSAVVLATLGST